mmetsp:Transcript_5619/g.14973  ORF Transcript_5619/g.14973 Transcript_5619/m.14973 type:complete len:290 (-) Transcript_5619:647-1516(-)
MPVLAVQSAVWLLGGRRLRDLSPSLANYDRMGLQVDVFCTRLRGRRVHSAHLPSRHGDRPCAPREGEAHQLHAHGLRLRPTRHALPGQHGGDGRGDLPGAVQEHQGVCVFHLLAWRHLPRSGRRVREDSGEGLSGHLRAGEVRPPAGRYNPKADSGASTAPSSPSGRTARTRTRLGDAQNADNHRRGDHGGHFKLGLEESGDLHQEAAGEEVRANLGEALEREAAEVEASAKRAAGHRALAEQLLHVGRVRTAGRDGQLDHGFAGRAHGGLHREPAPDLHGHLLDQGCH